MVNSVLLNIALLNVRGGQLKQFLSDLYHLGAAIGAGIFQHCGGGVNNFVGEVAGKLLQHRLWIIAQLQRVQGFLQLDIAQAFGFFAKGFHRAECIERTLLASILLYTFVDNLFGLVGS
jgi:hypothetical protein